jgi:hypothetical protein
VREVLRTGAEEVARLERAESGIEHLQMFLGVELLGERRRADQVTEEAIKHYEIGIRIGELSLDAGFDGVLPLGRNR